MDKTKIAAGCLAAAMVLNIFGTCEAAVVAAEQVPAPRTEVIEAEPKSTWAPLNISLDGETQRAIYQVCGEDDQWFCCLMAIGYIESRYTANLDGYCKGMFQIFEKHHRGRMEKLGVTNLYDPVQNAMVALDLLKELSAEFGGPESHALYMAYNQGAGGARGALSQGKTYTGYSAQALELYYSYLGEMGWDG